MTGPSHIMHCLRHTTGSILSSKASATVYKGTLNGHIQKTFGIEQSGNGGWLAGRYLPCHPMFSLSLSLSLSICVCVSLSSIRRSLL
jgi:hypothetical protein